METLIDVKEILNNVAETLRNIESNISLETDIENSSWDGDLDYQSKSSNWDRECDESMSDNMSAAAYSNSLLSDEESKQFEEYVEMNYEAEYDEDRIR